MNREQVGNWGSRLEAGVVEDPLLELAGRLSDRRLVPVGPDHGFVEQLREQLLEPPSASGHWSAVWLIPVVVVAAAVLTWVLVLLSAEPASAAEIFEDANRYYGSLAHEDGVLHSQFRLTYYEIDRGHRMVLRQHNWQGDLWGDLSGPDFRYQLIDDQGDYHYFAQRNGDQYWRSAYPVLASKGDLVYRLTEDQYYAPDVATSRLAPIFGDLIDWLELDGWWIENGAGCENPFCAIGLQEGDFWECEANRCLAHLSSAVGDIPAADLEVVLTGQERQIDGRTVDVMEIRYSLGDQLVRRLKFDARTHALVELIGYSYGVEQARMSFGSREILGSESRSVFTTLPDQLRETTWELDQAPPPQTPWLDSAGVPGPPRGAVQTVWMMPTVTLPAEGETLRAGSELQLYLEVNGPPATNLTLVAKLCRRPPPGPSDSRPSDISNCGVVTSASRTVAKGSGTTLVTIPVEPDEDWPDTVWLGLEWEYPNGQSAYLWFPDYFWLIDH